MGLSHSPKVVTDGLVFYYDQGNIQKSWRGAPATNLFTETNLNNWSKNATVSTTRFITPFDTPSYIITDDDTANWESISRSITVANDSSSHTISLMVRKTLGGTSARLGFNVSYSGGTSVTVNPRFNSDTGVTTYGTVIDYGDWWYWYFSLANNSTGNTSLNYNFYPATGVHNGSDNSTATGTAIVGAFMLVAGSVAVRFANGTRSNTQALLDMTRQNTIIANSVTYSSNNTFSFNGSTDPIKTSSNYGYPNNMTWGAWVKRSSSLNTYNMFMGAYLPYFSFRSGNFVTFSNSTGGSQRTISSTGVTLADNTWYHFMFTSEYDGAIGTTMKIYINGVLNNTGVFAGSQVNAGYPITIGSWYPAATDYPFNGIVDSVNVYSRALTAAEILQNFNALRGRYDI